jgi:E3 ubiquitin-protein ligase DOA10
MDINDSAPDVNPYTSAGIIVWYAFLVMFCLVPIISILTWIACKLCSEVEITETVQQVYEVDPQLERIEANVSAFNESEKLRKKRGLLMLMEDQTEVCRVEIAFYLIVIETAYNVSFQTINLHVLISNEKENMSHLDCQICLLTYDESEEIVKSNNPDCQHIFHKSCILEWLTSTAGGTCPICRGNFLDVDSIPNEMIHPLEVNLSLVENDSDIDLRPSEN